MKKVPSVNETLWVLAGGKTCLEPNCHHAPRKRGNAKIRCACCAIKKWDMSTAQIAEFRKMWTHKCDGTPLKKGDRIR